MCRTLNLLLVTMPEDDGGVDILRLAKGTELYTAIQLSEEIHCSHIL